MPGLCKPRRLVAQTGAPARKTRKNGAAW